MNSCLSNSNASKFNANSFLKDKYFRRRFFTEFSAAILSGLAGSGIRLIHEAGSYEVKVDGKRLVHSNNGPVVFTALVFL